MGNEKISGNLSSGGFEMQSMRTVFCAHCLRLDEQDLSLVGFACCSLALAVVSSSSAFLRQLLSIFVSGISTKHQDPWFCTFSDVKLCLAVLDIR